LKSGGLRLDPGSTAHDEADDEEDEKDEEENLRDACSSTGYTSEAEYGGNEGNDKENDGVVEHDKWLGGMKGAEGLVTGSWGRLEFGDEVPNVLFGLPCALLDASYDFLLLALLEHEIVVGELRPLLLDVALELVPAACEF